MLLLLSPAKTLNLSAPRLPESTAPMFQREAAELSKILCKYSPAELAALLKVSAKIASTNFEWNQQFVTNEALPAILMYQGDAYAAMGADKYTQQDLQFLQTRLRIISGLYGIVRPLDQIKPYRLEMSTRLPNSKGATLYAYWGQELTEFLCKEIEQGKHKQVINLASQEYVSAIDLPSLSAPVIDIVFQDIKGDIRQIIGINAKKARGSMVDFVVRNRLEDAHQLQRFSGMGYQFDQGNSTEDKWLFVR